MLIAQLLVISVGIAETFLLDLISDDNSNWTSYDIYLLFDSTNNARIANSRSNLLLALLTK